MEENRDIPEHDQPIRNHICHAHIHSLERIVLKQVLEHHDRDATRQPTSHERKAQKQHQPRLPRDAAAAVAEAVGAQPRLLDAVDHEHAKGGADAGDPVDEGDVLVGAIEGRFGEGGRINEEEETNGEL